MLPPLPRCSSWVYSSLISPRRVSLPRKGSPGRPAHRPFRGLLGVHLRCGLHTRAVTVIRDPLSEGFRHFVSSMPAPVASGWSEAPGGPCTHLSGALVSNGNFQHRGLNFCGSCEGVGVINGSFAISTKLRLGRRAGSDMSFLLR